MSAPESDTSQMEAVVSAWVIVQHQITQPENTNNIAHIASVLVHQLDETSKAMLLGWFRNHTGIDQVSIVRDIKARRCYIGPTSSFEEDFQVIIIQGAGSFWLWDFQVDGQDASINSCSISDEAARGFNKIRSDRIAAGISAAMLDIEISSSGDESFPFIAGSLDEASSPDTDITGSQHDSNAGTPIDQGHHQRDTDFGLVNADDPAGANLVQQPVYDNPPMSPSQVFDSGITQPTMYQPAFPQQGMAQPNVIHVNLQGFSAAATSLGSDYATHVASGGFTMQTSTHAMPNGSIVDIALPAQTQTTPSNGTQHPQPQTKIPRPPNAYILYRKDFHAQVRAANPGIHNNMISVILGKQWAAETTEIRSKYKKMAEDMKRKLHEKHPDYRYTPRRSSQIIRRRTKQTTTVASTAAGPSGSPS